MKVKCCCPFYKRHKLGSPPKRADCGADIMLCILFHNLSTALLKANETCFCIKINLFFLQK